MRCQSFNPWPILCRARGALLLALLAIGLRPGGALAEVLADAAAETAAADTAGFPGATWQHIDDPRQVGWDASALQSAQGVFERSGAAALVLAVDGRLLADWGHGDRRYPAHSMRKSLVSALIGNAAARGDIVLGASIGSLGIDDRTALSDGEKGATVRQLLAARSGIYLPANAQGTQSTPPRGSAAPGERWVYNNWDFNALGTIYERATGRDVFAGFAAEIAVPIGMQHFDPERDADWVRDAPSDHAAYGFNLSAHDLARFGLLFLRGGRWQGREVVDGDWVRESTSVHSPLVRNGDRMEAATKATGYGYGYMWWVGTLAAIVGDDRLAGSFSAEGHRGHLVLVAPRLDMVLVVRVDSRIPEWLPLLGQRFDGSEAVALLRALLAAAPTR